MSELTVGDRVEWIRDDADSDIPFGSVGTVKRLRPNSVWPVDVVFDDQDNKGLIPCYVNELKRVVERTQQEVVDPEGEHWHVHGTRIGHKKDDGKCQYCRPKREWHDKRTYKDAPTAPRYTNSYDWGWADGYNAAVKAWIEWTEEQG